MIPRGPGVSSRCTSSADVALTVRFARDHDLSVAVRGGGHNIAGKALCEGGLMIDLSPMRQVKVDAGARTARVEGGATLADVDRETQASALATPLGINSTTGIGGLTLGGGFGWLSRRFGLTIDNLISAEIVSAAGRTLTVSETQNADLFWGIRGGGGNFGVVTSFEFRLHKFGPNLVAGNRVFRIARAKELIPVLLEMMSGADDALSYTFGLTRSPPPGLPEGSYLEMEM